ncbi:ROK family transcriptional regulator [Salipaludibacillus sp. LMS25]|jgi:glucokinase-like ROK family protein|uniref:ROK family transcriptional regulator n=1 Tax=Salipaludibacillus sp. LMS25 TaxID=2924031 RepID=UPI0020D0BD73|nr:ROK family transcriptional regulator [Salipaludibacillus sp. LMS25]UTR13350.1 ROK family transcriptional regulator [Salipaludibacillus sp. LMS25]
MAAHLTGSFQLMKSLNRSLILNIIRTSGAISRSEIAKQTGLTPPTVTNIVNELLDEELVLESRAGTSNGGRKPILLTIKSDSRYIIGVDVGVKKVRLALTNLNANVLQRKLLPMPHTQVLTTEQFLDFLQQAIDTFLTENVTQKKKIIGIGVAMHGIVDHEQGIAIHAPTLKLERVPVKQMLEQAFNLPVRVENDAKALALGEKWFGAGRDVDHFVCLNVGEGIGGGIILNDHLFHGNNSLAGEIGHTKIDFNGPTCSCGNNGCFQTLASGQAVKERAHNYIKQGKKTSLAEVDLKDLDGQLIYKCAEEGDEIAKKVLEETGAYLGFGLLNIIHFLNPSMVIIGGGVSKSGKWILEPAKAVIQSYSLSREAARTTIGVSELGDEGSLIGACTLVLSELFSHTHSK